MGVTREQVRGAMPQGEGAWTMRRSQKPGGVAREQKKVPVGWLLPHQSQVKLNWFGHFVVLFFCFCL